MLTEAFPPELTRCLLCCLAPLGLLMLGVSGAWIVSLVATELHRPTLVIVTLLFSPLP